MGKCTFLITKKMGHLKCNSVCNIPGASWMPAIMCAPQFIQTH